MSSKSMNRASNRSPNGGSCSNRNRTIIRSAVLQLCAVLLLVTDLFAISPPLPQDLVPTQVPPASPTLPHGAVIVTTLSQSQSQSNSQPTTSNESQPPLQALPDSEPLFVQQRCWGVLLDVESGAVLVPAHLIAPFPTATRFVSAPTSSGSWQRYTVQVRAIEFWSDWALLEPENPEEIKTDNASQPIAVDPAWSQLQPSRLTDLPGSSVQGLPTPDSWLFDPAPKLWQGTWSSERGGLKIDSSDSTEITERWFEFDGLQRIDAETDWQPGPLFNADGVWIGWATMWEIPGRTYTIPEISRGAASESSREQPAIVWAFPNEPAQQRLWIQLLRAERPAFGFLGIRPRGASDSVRMRGHQGVTVYEAAPATPAARADLQYGDLITHLDGQPIDSPNRLLWEIAAREPGSILNVSLLRGTLTDRPERVDKTIRLSKRPDYLGNPLEVQADPNSVEIDAPGSAPTLLIDWCTASPKFADQADRLPMAGGVWIAWRSVALPAELNELQAGTWIVAVGEQAPESPAQFQELLGQAGDMVELSFLGPGDSAPHRIQVPRTLLQQVLSSTDH